MSQLEYCCVCGEPTGRAGAGDDSIYIGLNRDWMPLGLTGPRYCVFEEVGPLCCDCYQIAKDCEVISG